MNSMTLRAGAALALALALAPTARAQDPAIVAALQRGQGAPWLRARTGRVQLLVRFERPELVPSVAALENRGVTWMRAGGRPLAWREWALVTADARGARALASLPGVREVRAAPPLGLPPLDRSAELLGLEAARGASHVSERWTGEGVLVADLDSHVDVFHPDLFRADAGWYDWVDLDGDGVYSSGDGIDVDGDGSIDAGERTRVLRATPIDLGGRSTGSLTRPRFDPGVDWIYCDEDANGERDFGPRFGDSAPALGEPLFVPDDVDGDGALEPEERLVRLGTSKLRAAYVHVDWFGISHDHVYERGVDLSSSPNDVTGGLYGYADTLHATGVLGILVGGVPLPSRRWVGIAPDAEVVNAFEISESDAPRMMWALAQEPDVMLHEYVTWTNVALDGGDAFSSLIDASAAEGIVHVCPGGNIGGAGKHAQRELAAGEEHVFRLTIPAGLRQIEISIHARGAGVMEAELVEPGGTTHALGVAESDGVLASGGRWYAYGETTDRETQMRSMAIADPGASQLSVRVRAEGGSLVVHALSADEQGFSESAVWEDASDASTLAWPATADSCIAVGSVPSHPASDGPWYESSFEVAGQVRGYSARGPRIDGDLRPHVLAPDNPWSALGHGDLVPSSPGSYPIEHGAYMVFGGTSGAGPHVAGVAALLAQTGLRGAEVAARIRESAIDEGLGGALPNDDYGYGRLSAVGALRGDASGSPPTITLRAEPARARPGEPIRLLADASDPDGQVSIRWDDDYDGEWDTSYVAPSDRTVAFPREGTYRWRVRVRDEAGLVADAAAMVIVSSAPPPVPDAGLQPDDGGVDGGVAPPSGGCGCRAGASPSSAGWLLAVLLVIWRRR